MPDQPKPAAEPLSDERRANAERWASAGLPGYFYISDLLDELRRVERENERLRAALRAIEVFDRWGTPADLAHAALAGPAS